MVLFLLILIFIIPKPFSRIIILSLIYSQYFNTIEIKSDLKSILLFGIFVFSFLINILLVRGDIILTLGMMVISGVALFYIAFRKDLRKYSQNSNIPSKEILTKTDWKNVSIIIFTTFMWSKESIHNISSTIIVILGCILFFFTNTLQKKVMKSLNISLMFF